MADLVLGAVAPAPSVSSAESAPPNSATSTAAHPLRTCVPISRFKPVTTPWGSADSATAYADGITRYTTCAHGGFGLAPDRFAAMPPPLQACASFEVQPGQRAWFEEDVDWCAVVLAYPALFSPDERQCADSTLRNWRHVQWEALHGRSLADGESVSKDRRRFFERHRHDWLAIAAYGAGTPGVPAGMVRVCATRGGLRGEAAPLSYWLVDQAVYRSAGIAFVIDPQRHTRVDSKL